MKRLVPMLLCVLPLCAQGRGPISLFPAALRDYLGLTNAQTDSINRLNLDYNRFVLEKQLRITQVQREINEETQRQQLDPMALGLRYVEMESIRREMRERLDITRRDVLAVLNDPQRARLKTLEDALKLQPLINQAQCENLLPPAQGQAVPSGIVRLGDLTGLPVAGVMCGPLRP